MISYKFSIIPGRRIIKETMYGFWNKEIALRYSNDYKHAVKPLLGDSWVKCLDLREWNPSNPKVMNILRKHIDWAIKNRMALSANIVTANVPELQMNTIMKSGIPVVRYNFFKNEESAMEWLKTMGY